VKAVGRSIDHRDRQELRDPPPASPAIELGQVVRAHDPHEPCGGTAPEQFRNPVQPLHRPDAGAEAKKPVAGCNTHRISHLYVDLEVTRAAVLKALQSLDEEFDNAAAIVAVAKARAGTSGTLAVQEALQMHGGIGMTDQFDIGLFMKRMRVCQELFGDSNYQGDQLAQLRNY
jgi:hypothetical protein